jgi:hypothetical protein
MNQLNLEQSPCSRRAPRSWRTGAHNAPWLFSLGATLLGFATPQLAAAMCTDGGYPQALCDDPKLRVCDESDCPVVQPKTYSGTVQPKYMVMTVVYAPPGANGCTGASSVEYGSESSLGTTVSMSKTVKKEVGVTVTAGAMVAGNGGSVSASFATSKSTTDSASLEIKKTTTSTLHGPTVCQDGINHDFDTIYLWLNPQFDVTMTGDTLTWQPTPGAVTDIQWVTVQQLKGSASLSDGMQNAVQAYGIDQADFAEILRVDPFAADPSATPDPSRFVPIGMTFPYEPSPTPGYVPPSTTLKMSYQETNTQAHSAEVSTSVGLSVTGMAGFATIFSAKLEVSGKWTWSQTNSASESNSATNSATVTVGTPAAGYTGPTRLSVYYDVIYGTFVFTPVEGEL